MDRAAAVHSFVPRDKSRRSACAAGHDDDIQNRLQIITTKVIGFHPNPIQWPGKVNDSSWVWLDQEMGNVMENEVFGSSKLLSGCLVNRKWGVWRGEECVTHCLG